MASEKSLKYVGQEEAWGWWPGLGFSVQVVRGPVLAVFRAITNRKEGVRGNRGAQSSPNSWLMQPN